MQIKRLVMTGSIERHDDIMSIGRRLFIGFQCLLVIPLVLIAAVLETFINTVNGSKRK